MTPYGIETLFTYKNFKKLINKYGKTNKQIAEEVKDFTLEVPRIQKHGNPEFYAYYADYDWVVFCWLFGKMNDLPNGFPMYCNDLKQTLDEKVKDSGGEFSARLHNIRMMKDYPKQTNEHNALSDARWNKELYNYIKTL